MRDLVARTADRLLALVVPHVSAEAFGAHSYWSEECACRDGYVWRYYCVDAVGPNCGAGCHLCTCERYHKEAFCT